MLDSEPAPRLAAVLGQPLELGDLPLAFASSRVVCRQRLDQAPDPVPHLQREVGGGGTGEDAHVLDRHVVRRRQQPWALGLAHFSPPILASSASASISACWL